jgi:hypothetical protein
MRNRSGPDRREPWRWLCAVAVAAACGLATSAQAQQAAKEAPAEPAAAAAPVAPPDLIDPKARDAVKRMVQTLTAAQRMEYEYESSYDALQDDGEKLEFGSYGKTLIRRPDRLAGEVWFREGRHVRYAWDGKDVSIYDDERNVVAKTPRTGDLDSLVDFLRDEVGFRLPLADLFMSDLGPMLVENVVAARWIGQEKDREGVETEHVALRLRTGVDVQLWIRAGDEAVPKRIILDFATADGRPQFRGEFHKWNLDPRARDSAFELDVPKQAKKVPFVLPPKTRGAEPQEEPE